MFSLYRTGPQPREREQRGTPPWGPGPSLASGQVNPHSSFLFFCCTLNHVAKLWKTLRGSIHPPGLAAEIGLASVYVSPDSQVKL